ncbi:DUF4232 domain-containing protein [Agromyces archimandritae]|uniref:DUF4232 domain-containing protein n=1 Tax=Agromyces archimandritae TaxID=2781962 RepID=A0A975IPJ2_9MICO|nr:DUF4232 domain-containing protein [Agromyces archimandritae]QTX04056.1 DUF4232 domain-containing protein [Agromyces archimandritae]
MRVVRVLVPAILAVAAWFASDRIAEAAAASFSTTVSKALRLIAPGALIGPVDAPGGWGGWLAFATVVAVAAAYAVFALVFRAGRGAAGFAAGWFAAVLAGSLVAGVPVAVSIIAGVLDPVAAASAADVVSIGLAAYWGVLWGWMPALAAVLLAPKPAAAAAPSTTPAAAEGAEPEPEPAAAAAHPAAPRRRAALIAAIAVVAVTGLVAVVIAGIGATDAKRAADQAEWAAEQPPVPEPVGVPIPEVAPGEWNIDPEWCTENQLEYTPSTPDSAMMHRGMKITARNVSSAPCVLDGYPDVAFSDPVGNGFESHVLHGDGHATERDAGPVRIEVVPGGEAVTWLSWDAPAASDRDPAGFLHIAPYAGAVRQMVPIDTDITGGELEITAWQAAAPAA